MGKPEDDKAPPAYQGVEMLNLSPVFASASAVTSAAIYVPGEPFEYWLRANMRQFPVTLDLPDALRAWIGRIVSHWALAEWLQSGTVARLMGISRKEARVVLGDRIGNCASKIKQLMEMKGLALPDDLSDLAGLLTKCENARNLLSHGVWMLDPGIKALCVQNPSGEWINKVQGNVSKRKYPEAFVPTHEWLESTLKDMQRAIRRIEEIDKGVAEKLGPSPQTLG